jgi:hypothetical protein
MTNGRDFGLGTAMSGNAPSGGQRYFRSALFGFWALSLAPSSPAPQAATPALSKSRLFMPTPVLSDKSLLKTKSDK